MAYMFSGCYVIQKVDLSSFDISNVNNNLYPNAVRDVYKMHGFMSMFNYCTSLQEVTFGNHPKDDTEKSNMYNKCPSTLVVKYKE